MKDLRFVDGDLHAIMDDGADVQITNNRNAFAGALVAASTDKRDAELDAVRVALEGTLEANDTPRRAYRRKTRVVCREFPHRPEYGICLTIESATAAALAEPLPWDGPSPVFLWLMTEADFLLFCEEVPSDRLGKAMLGPNCVLTFACDNGSTANVASIRNVRFEF